MYVVEGEKSNTYSCNYRIEIVKSTFTGGKVFPRVVWNENVDTE